MRKSFWARLVSPSPLDPSGPRRGARRRILFAWIWVVFWACIVWMLGGDDFSSAATSRGILDWLRWFTDDLDPRSRYRLLVGIRKSAHLIEYAILALLTFRAALISAGRSQLTTAAWVALFLVAILAAADEARQALSPVRTGSPYDVVIDLTGGALAVIGLVVISRRMRTAEDPSVSSGGVVDRV